MALADALKRLEAGDPVGALEALLAVWREARHPALARAIERLSELLPGARDPLSPDTWSELAGARRPAELGRVLANVDELAVARWLPALRAWPPDPRIAAAATAWQRGWRDSLARACALELLQVHRDPALELHARALDADEEAALARLEERLEAGALPTDPLLDAVHYDPDDDAARLVLADALLLRDDPRGELIVLQFARPGRRRARRERELVARHGRAWLGPIAAAIEGVPDFERGFPSAGQLADFWPRGLARHPEWSTFRALDVRRPHRPQEVIAILASRHARTLRRVSGVRPQLIDALVARGEALPLESLAVTGWRHGLESGDLLPRLRRLELEVTASMRLADVEAIVASPLGGLLAELQVDLPDEAVAAMVALAAPPRVVVRSPAARYTIDRPTRTLALDRNSPIYDAVLAALPPGCLDVVRVGRRQRDDHARLRALLARSGARLELV